VNALHQSGNQSTKLVANCNHVNQNFGITFHNVLQNALSPNHIQTKVHAPTIQHEVNHTLQCSEHSLLTISLHSCGRVNCILNTLYLYKHRYVEFYPTFWVFVPSILIVSFLWRLRWGGYIKHKFIFLVKLWIVKIWLISYCKSSLKIAFLTFSVN